LNWLSTNKTWLFSGIGAIAIVSLFELFWDKLESEPEQDNLTQLENSREVNIKENKNASSSYEDIKIQDGSYIFSQTEQLRAIELYKEEFSINSGLADEIELTILAQMKEIETIEAIPSNERSLEQREKLEQLRKNYSSFKLLDKKIKELLVLHQQNLSELAQLMLNPKQQKINGKSMGSDSIDLN